ncbi:MAG: hypothetical protein IJR18_03720 [Campylobacter sp.]|nr:hypothetical protein [Campylobacter sp.]
MKSSEFTPYCAYSVLNIFFGKLNKFVIARIFALAKIRGNRQRLNSQSINLHLVVLALAIATTTSWSRNDNGNEFAKQFNVNLNHKMPTICKFV